MLPGYCQEPEGNLSVSPGLVNSNAVSMATCASRQHETNHGATSHSISSDQRGICGRITQVRAVVSAFPTGGNERGVPVPRRA